MNLKTWNTAAMAQLVQTVRNTAMNDSHSELYKQAALLVMHTDDGRIIGSPISAANQLPQEIMQQAQYDPTLLQPPQSTKYEISAIERLLVIVGASVAATIEQGMAHRSFMVVNATPGRTCI